MSILNRCESNHGDAEDFIAAIAAAGSSIADQPSTARSAVDVASPADVYVEVPLDGDLVAQWCASAIVAGSCELSVAPRGVL